MTRVLDLGMREGTEISTQSISNTSIRDLEEAYYCSDIVYEVIAPLPGIAIARPLRLSDDLEITNSAS